MYECPICKKKTSQIRCPDCGLYLARVTDSAARAAAPEGQLFAPPTQKGRLPNQAKGLLIVAAFFLAVMVTALLLNIDERAHQQRVERDEMMESIWQGGYLDVLSVERGSDRWGNPAAIVTYVWTNDTDEPHAFSWFYESEVSHDGGILLETSWPEGEGDQGMAEPGETQMLRLIYALDTQGEPAYEGGPITVSVKSAQGGAAISREFAGI